MRILLITQEEPFYLPPALDTLCALRAGEVVGMVILPSFNESLGQTALRLYRFYGPVDFVRLCGRYAVARLADRLEGVFPRRGRPYSARAVARRRSLPMWCPADVNGGDFLTVVREEIRPDIIVSIAASQIFRRALLSLPPLGCINLHSAPLPRYQGMMPNFWTLLHGESEAAVTVHMMAAKLDAGDIIVQRPVEIRPDDSLHRLMIRSKDVGIQAVDEALSLLQSGRATPHPMDPDQASYFSFPTRRDARALRRQGRSLL